MLSPTDNELLCHVGPDAPMGRLLRQYWVPALLSSELPVPDGAPLRVRLLGEDLIAFRDTRGRPGFLANACPHRGASLFFGRNEEEGLRCVYHGWKFDVGGQCVDMPNEPAESNFRHKIRITAYPCREIAGTIFVYMGPRLEPPPLPDFEWMLAPAEQTHHRKVLRYCNWVQALEGDLDGSHTSFLHTFLRRADDGKPLANGYRYQDGAPRLQVVLTDYGAMYGYSRNAGEYAVGSNDEYTRITQYLFPFYVMIGGTDPVVGDQGGPEATKAGSRIWVPMDDETTVLWMISSDLVAPEKPTLRNVNDGVPSKYWGIPDEYLPPTSAPGGAWRPVTNRENDYLIDREVQRTLRYVGIPGGQNPEDQAVTESMGRIYTRQREHLGTTDAMIIQVRRRLLQVVKSFAAKGAAPAGVDRPELYRVRSGSAILPRGADWVEATRLSRLCPADRPGAANHAAG